MKGVNWYSYGLEITHILEPKRVPLFLLTVLIPLYRDANTRSDNATYGVTHPVITNGKNHLREARKARRSAAC